MTRINTNVPAIVAMGRFRNNTNDLYTRLERLSTGLRINRGKDDPAGLIASEVLRKEMRGLQAAIGNTQRAINVISVAEGALNEVSALLLDLKALVLDIANEGAVSDEEVYADQLEIDAILSSIDRIANTTTFAGKKLLNGAMAYQISGINTTEIAHTSVYAARITEGTPKEVILEVHSAAEMAHLSFAAGVTSAATVEIAGRVGVDILSFQSGATQADIAQAINGITDVTGVRAIVSTDGQLHLLSTEYGSDAFVSVRSVTGTFMNSTAAGTTTRDDGFDPIVTVNGQLANTHGLRVDTRTQGLEARFYLTSSLATGPAASTFHITGGGSLFQITPQINPQGQLHVGVDSISTSNLGNTVTRFLSDIRSGGEYEVARGHYIKAEEIITEAINQIASLRGRLGAVQKQKMETNVNSQQIAFENVTASESAIRDADYAVEVSALTRAQILIQGTQLTLNVAQQVPQTALSLLGG